MNDFETILNELEEFLLEQENNVFWVFDRDSELNFGLSFKRLRWQLEAAAEVELLELALLEAEAHLD